MTRRVILLLGMHRSGTSMLARAVGRLGVPLGGKLLEAPRPDNPLGYAEHAAVVAAQDQLLETLVGGALGLGAVRRLPASWVESPAARQAAAAIETALAADLAACGTIAVKDPRMALLLPLWRGVLARLGAAPTALLIHRHPAAVAQSLLRRDGIPPALGEALWLRHLGGALRDGAGWLPPPALVLDYDDALAAPDEALAGLAAALDRPPPEPGLAADLLRPALRHHAPSAAILAPAAALHGVLRSTLPARLAAEAAPILAGFDALLRGLDASPGWLEHALGFAGAGRFPLLLPFPLADGAADADAALPGLPGARLRLRHGNPWTLPVPRGVQIHASLPDAPPILLAWEGLPAPGAGGAFVATAVTPQEAPPLRCRITLSGPGGAAQETVLDLPPGSALPLRLVVPDGADPLSIAVSVSVAPGSTTHAAAALRLLAPRLED